VIASFLVLLIDCVALWIAENLSFSSCSDAGLVARF